MDSLSTEKVKVDPVRSLFIVFENYLHQILSQIYLFISVNVSTSAELYQLLKVVKLTIIVNI